MSSTTVATPGRRATRRLRSPGTKSSTASTSSTTPAVESRRWPRRRFGFDSRSPHTDIAVAGYNSDHRAVVVEFALPECTGVAGDLNGDCSLDATDWAILRQHQHSDLSSLTPTEAYQLGDLTGDLRNDHADFIAFKSLYESLHGPEGFLQLLVSAPEPSAGGALVLAVVAIHAIHRVPRTTR